MEIDHYNGIGGSMASAVMGLNRYKTPYQAWLEYTDPASRPDLSVNEAVEWGTALEPVIAQVAARRWGIEIEYQPQEIRHPRLHFMRAHVDALVKGELAGMEVKNRGLMMRAKYGEASEDEDGDDTDNVLPDEAIQCQTYMACTGYDTWYLPVLTGGQRLLRFKLKRDNAIIAKIEAACVEFWKHVESGTPPEPTTQEDANRRWPQHAPGKVIELTPELDKLVKERRELKERLKDGEVALDVCELQIKRAMQDAEEIRQGGKRILGWKTQTREHFDQKRFREAYPDLVMPYIEEKKLRVLR